MAEEPVAVVDLINDKAGLEDNHVGDHGIVERISVFGDVEIFLDSTSRVEEERPVGTISAAAANRAGGPGTGTRLADRRAAQPYLLSPFRL